MSIWERKVGVAERRKKTKENVHADTKKAIKEGKKIKEIQMQKREERCTYAQKQKKAALEDQYNQNNNFNKRKKQEYYWPITCQYLSQCGVLAKILSVLVCSGG